MPQLSRIDHIHIYVSDRDLAERWYSEVLGFRRVQALEFWSDNGGPLTIANGDVHLALFEKTLTSTTVAFAVDALNYREWKKHLDHHDVTFREENHDLAWSIYFQDPFTNPYEITCYDWDDVSRYQDD